MAKRCVHALCWPRTKQRTNHSSTCEPVSPCLHHLPVQLLNSQHVTAAQVRICQRAFRVLVEEVGLNPEDVVFDPNILTVGTGLAEHNNYGVDFIRATRIIKHVCPGCKISSGVSNIAFSFRGNEAVRRAFHSAFLHHACAAGMDMGIVNAAQVPPQGAQHTYVSAFKPIELLVAVAAQPSSKAASPR